MVPCFFTLYGHILCYHVEAKIETSHWPIQLHAHLILLKGEKIVEIHSVLSMHIAILCEKEDVNIRQDKAYINHIFTHLCKNCTCYILINTVSQLTEFC